MTMGVRQNHRATALVRRGQLKINDPQAAEGVTAVDVWADLEAGGVRFRLSIIYNDLSDPGWWKDKREKLLGDFAVAFGQTDAPRYEFNVTLNLSGNVDDNNIAEIKQSVREGLAQLANRVNLLERRTTPRAIERAIKDKMMREAERR